jgi:hypothetical protein
MINSRFNESVVSKEFLVADQDSPGLLAIPACG